MKIKIKMNKILMKIAQILENKIIIIMMNRKMIKIKMKTNKKKIINKI